MPAVATHYKFGQLVLENLPTNIKKAIAKHKSLFDLATQGPDILFYHNVLKRDAVVDLGVGIHSRSGEQFFGDILERRLTKKPQVMAYVLGCFCHYSLDVACHPYVIKASQNGDVMHRVLESDMDLAMINRYGMTKKRHKYISTNVDFSAIATVYKITEEEAKRSVKNMRLNNYVLNSEKLVSVLDDILKKKKMFDSLTLKKEISAKKETEHLVELFDAAIQPTVANLIVFYDALQYNKPLPQGFTKNFEGEIV